jgi:ABC-type branched-subunit amino acid transport system substrate-binding protein
MFFSSLPYLGIIVAIGNPKFEDDLGDGVNYITGPVQWDASIRTSGADVFNGSAVQFTALYESAYEELPSYQAASGAGAAVFLQTAIELVGSLDRQLVMSVLQGLRFSSFYGEIGVDITGANRAKTMVWMCAIVQ